MPFKDKQSGKVRSKTLAWIDCQGIAATVRSGVSLQVLSPVRYDGGRLAFCSWRSLSAASSSLFCCSADKRFLICIRIIKVVRSTCKRAA